MYSKFYKIVIPILLVIAFVRFGYAQISGNRYTTYNITDALYILANTEVNFSTTISVYQSLRDFCFDASGQLEDVKDEIVNHQSLKDSLSTVGIDEGSILFNILAVLTGVAAFLYSIVYAIVSLFLIVCWLFSFVLAFAIDLIGIVSSFFKLLFSFFGMDSIYNDPGYRGGR